MSDYESAKMFQEYFDRMMAERNDADYIVDPVQQGKLFAIVNQFSKIIEETNGRFVDYTLIPRMKHGYVTAVFGVVNLNGESIREFCNTLSEASAISIDAAMNGVCVSVTVPDVFRCKS